MVYVAIVALDVILAVVILVFILGARASEEAHRHR
jgi:hypothetical protein